MSSIKCILTQSSEIDFLRYMLWSGLVLMLGIDCTILLYHGMFDKIMALPKLYFIVGVFLLLSTYLLSEKSLYHHFLEAKKAAIFTRALYFSEALSFAFLLIPATIIAFYGVVIASSATPYIDHYLAQADTMLGLNWLTYTAWLNNNPMINTIYSIAYTSIILQGATCITVFVIINRPDKSYRFLLTSLIGLIITVILVWLFPSEGIIPFKNINPKDYPLVDMSFGYIHLPNLHVLRTGALRPVIEGMTIGIVTFPSFHTTIALLYIAAFLQVPYIRWIFLFLNLLMLAATPIMGGHYFTDCLAGAAVAALSIWGAKLIIRMKPHTDTQTPTIT